MKYLEVEDIILIHSIIIDETGGMHGICDRHSLLSAEAQPRQNVFGRELYPGIFSKAAAYARNIIMNHPFMDGNKRTGITAALVFLENNDYKITVPGGQVEKFALRIVKEKLDVKTIADWLENHTTPPV